MSKVDIANKALSYIGEETIISFNEDTRQARLVNQHYDLCKRTLLTQHNWWFAMKREALTQIADHEDEKYPYAFQFPRNCLKMVRTDACGMAWQRFQDQLFTTSDKIVCEYLFDVDESDFIPSFETALVYYLASRIAMALSGDKATKQEAHQMYGQSLLMAITANDTEQGIQWLERDSGSQLRRGFIRSSW